MADGRRNNGGHSTKGKAGRKPKADEDRIRTMSIGAMSKIFGSEEKAWMHLAEMAQESYPHMRLLFEYTYGKPKESKSVEIVNDQPIFNVTIE